MSDESIDDEAIDTDVRIWAIEILLTLMMASDHLEAPDPYASLSKIEKALHERAEKQTFSGSTSI